MVCWGCGRQQRGALLERSNAGFHPSEPSRLSIPIYNVSWSVLLLQKRSLFYLPACRHLPCLVP